MKRIYRYSPILIAALALAACGGSSTVGSSMTEPTSPAATSSMTEPTTPVVKLGQPFRNGNVEITVTKVVFGVKLLDVDAKTKAEGITGFTPDNGQFVVVYATAKNVGHAPATFSIDSSTITDVNGDTYTISAAYLGPLVGQGFGDRQQPGVTKSGWLAFDVSPTVTAVKSVSIQSDPDVSTTNVPTVVTVLS